MKKRTNNISIIIPTYNRKDDLLNALGSIYRQDYEHFEVIVVDNNSTDGTVQLIKETYPQTKVIALDKNQGPAVARNAGIINSSGEIIVGIDSDAILVGNDNFKKIIDKINEKPSIGCLTFRILRNYDKQDDRDRWWHPMPIQYYCDKEFFTDYFSGTAFAVKKEALDKSGLFPEEIFIIGEEVELSLKILDNDFDIYYYPSVSVYHNIAQNKSRTKEADYRKYYLKRRNQLWIVIKYYPFIKGFIFIIPRLVNSLLSAMITGNLGLYFRGLYEGIKYIPRELKLRMPCKKETWDKIRLIRNGNYIPTSHQGCADSLGLPNVPDN